MSLLKNSKFALVVMIAVIALTAVFGCGRSLRALQRGTEDIFFEGINGDEVCIASDILRNWEIASNMLTIGQTAFDGEITEVMTELDQQLDRLTATDDPVQIMNENQVLAELVDSFYEELAGTELSEYDEKQSRKLYAEMDELNRIIANDEYHDAVLEANAALEAFPANILRHLTGVKAIETR